MASQCFGLRMRLRPTGMFWISSDSTA